MFTNPVYSWKNLTYNPNVRIRSDILKVLGSLPKLVSVVNKLKVYGADIRSAVSEIAYLDVKIKSKGEDLRKAKVEKKKVRLDKELKSLLARKESIAKKYKGIDVGYVKQAADAYIDFDDLIDIFFRLNMMSLTLIHRARKDIDDIIYKVRALKHEDVAGLERLKADSIAELNRQKEHIRLICGELYLSSEFQERGKFNPSELANEISFQGTPVKCRRIKHLTVEIDNIEGSINRMLGDIRLNRVSDFARSELALQISDFKRLAHHIKILTHRFEDALNRFPDNRVLKKKLHKRLKDIVRQTRMLWNSIHVHPYHAKFFKMPKRKEIKFEHMKKAA